MERRTTTRSSADLMSKHKAKNNNSQKEVATNLKQLGVNKRQRLYVANHNARAIAGVSVLNRTRLHATSPASEPTPLPTVPTPVPSAANSGGLNSNVPIPGQADEPTTEHADHMNVEIEHDHINMNVEMTVNYASTSIGVQSPGLTELPKKNVRGKTRGLNADKAQMQFGGKLPITIVKKEGRPTGTYAEMFASEIGFVIRNHAPLNVEKWSHVSDQIKENLVKKLNTKFEFDMKQTLVKRYVYTTFGKRFTNFRNKLRKYFEEFQTLEAALQKKHKDVKTDEEWKFLCNYFSSEAFKKKSQTNSQNRANLKLHHKTGSRSFQSHQKHVVGPKTGLPLGAIDYFERQYSSTKKGWDVGAKPLWEEMVQMRSDTTLEDGTRSMTDDEICKQVLGEKSGYVKGCGFGPQPPPKYSSQASTEEMNERNQELQEKLDETQQIVQSQADEIIALQDKAKKFEEFMANFNIGQEATQQDG